MKKWNERRLPLLLAALLIIAMAAGFGLTMRRSFMEIRQQEAENILLYYSENIMLQMRGALNQADTLAQTARIIGDQDTAWFEKAACSLLSQEEIRYVCLIDGDTMVSALPAEQYGDQVGHDLKDFSYTYTLAKVVKELVVEGPITIGSGDAKQEVFLFLQPFVSDNAYLGEVGVALDRDYVLEQMGLRYLTEQGYDYELWRVNPQSGDKEVVSTSGSGVDFSHAAKTSFNLPTQWNLSIQPMDGWISRENSMTIILVCALAAFLLLGLCYTLSRLRTQAKKLKNVSLTDRQTGLYNQAGFTTALDRCLAEQRGPIVLFYFVFEGYNEVAQLIGPEAEAAFLQSIPRRLAEYIESPFLAGRLQAGNFAIAVREDMNESQRKDFARGLSLELLLKIRLNGEKSFLTARYQYAPCPPNGQAADIIATLIRSYYAYRSKESPARMLTQKCRQLIEGQSNVVFEEYTDLEMMELSKTFNQYRKQVEQLAYFDPVFNVGNRPKYLRDANMLISYDKKRQFSLFCVDICAFSQYNELFSADIGDQILREVLRRLSRPFGTYLYRINGDVFLGISRSNESEQVFASRLQQLLTKPVLAGNASFALQVRIAVCRYPTHGDTPEVLLDRIQAALRFSKESNQHIMIYHDELDAMIRTEAEILRLLKASIEEKTLEIWYQPIMNLENRRYTAVEALTRLPNGKGGYFPAGLVISLAERSGMVEQLGDYVLTHACRFMHMQGKALGLLRTGINLSVQQLLVRNSADHILRLIRTSGVDPKLITLEITESVLIQSIERACATLDRLRNTGVHIALDDFGVGYSSLNYLSNLPVDVIKIDRSLTQQILTNPKQHALLRSIVEMAEINSLAIVAEGVETMEEQSIISASGVHFIQGFYYARPMSQEQLIRFLKDKK